jgi:hypothetical protein
VADVFKPDVGDNENDEGIFHMELGTLSMDMAFTDTYLNADQEEVRGVGIVLEDVTGAKPDNFKEIFSSLLLKLLGPLISGSKIPVGPIAIPLAGLLTGEDNSGDGGAMAALLEDLSLPTTLFLNLYGLPVETGPNFALMGGGVYAVDAWDVETVEDDAGNVTSKWPDVDTDNLETGLYANLDKIRHGDLGIAMAQYNLNHMIKGMMRGFKLVVRDAETLGIPGFAPQKPGNSLDMVMTVNPAGAAMELKPYTYEGRTSIGRFALNDIRLELVEAGVPKAELSMDLNMMLDLSLRVDEGEYLIELAMKPIYALSNFHVLKDDLGVGNLDHGGFVEIAFTLLIEEGKDAFILPLPLGLTHKDGADVRALDFDEHGNCFMNLAVEAIDTSAFCFISTTFF